MSETTLRTSPLYPVLVLESLLSRRARRALLFVGKASAVLFAALVAAQVGRAALPPALVAFIPMLSIKLIGLFLLVGAGLTVVWLLELYFRAHYYGSIVSNDYGPHDLYTFTVGRILYGVRRGDVARAFIESETGARVLARAGVGPAALRDWLVAREAPPELVPPLRSGRVLFLAELVEWLVQSDKAFGEFLFRQGVTREVAVGAAAWTAREVERAARAERWWTREALSAIPGIASDWSFGRAWQLSQFGRDLVAEAEAVRPETSTLPAELDKLLTILVRAEEANALVTIPPGDEPLTVLWELAGRLRTGTVHPALRGKRLFLFDAGLFLATAKSRQALEEAFVKLWAEARRAGNIIIAVDNLPHLLRTFEALGSNLLELLDPYLSAPDLPVIAVVDSDTYARELEPHAGLLRRFERLKIEATNRAGLLRLAENLAATMEARFGLLLTYSGLVAVVTGAERYSQAASLGEEVRDYIVELGPWAQGRGLAVLDAAAVGEFIKGKTNIPVGAVGQSERRLLLDLEERLGERVIGQATALRVVAAALRRGRADIRNEKRPIAAFLFLGPTGVGKTETAKALAELYFGEAEAMTRLDMSEFQGSEAVGRLIGTNSEPGILATRVRERSYGLVLLDEFEKAHPDVLNLFLQVFDEGFFSDAQGRRVNARNLIFIATSNAGADFIWEVVKAGRNPAEARAELVDQLVARSIFRPELLNRFDDTVIFQPLGPEELVEVARLLLERLAKRLLTQSIEFAVTDELVRVVATRGANQLFGARPMQRFIQDSIEDALAKKIMAGELPPGSKVRMTADFAILME